MITLKFHLNLVNFTKKKEMSITINEPIILEDLLEEIGIPSSFVGLIIKNGKWNTIHCSLNNGDIVELFPYLLGG